MTLTIEERLDHIETMLADLATVPAAVHNVRVAELLQANNREVHERRVLQAQLQAMFSRNNELREGMLRLIRKLEQLMRNSEGIAGLSMGDEVVRWAALQTGGAYSHWLGDEIQMALDIYNAKLDDSRG